MGNEELTAMFAQNSTKEDLNFIARFFRRFIDAIKKVFGGNKKYQQYVHDADKLLGVFERAVKNNIDKASGKEYNNETRYAVTSTPSGENSVFDDKQRKDVIRKLSAVAKMNGVTLSVASYCCFTYNFNA